MGRGVKAIKLAIFDMDGTVFESYLDWSRIRKELEIETNILKEIYNGDRVDYRRLEILERYEADNTLKTRPVRGITEYLSYLRNRGIKTALVTNNNRKNTDFLLEKFDLVFDTVVTRETGLWKPEPDAFYYVMKMFDSKPGEIVSIGDSHYDIRASKAAGIDTIYIISERSRVFPRIPTDDSGVVYFDDYYHLMDIFRAGEPTNAPETMK
jgi:HAD superfamily hydrolase (TIGR01509 family)